MVNSLFKADIQAKLNKNLQCHPRNDLSNSKWVHLSPQDDCQSGIAQSGNNLLVIGLSVGLLVGCLIMFGLVVFCWRRKMQEKYNCNHKNLSNNIPALD